MNIHSARKVWPDPVLKCFLGKREDEGSNKREAILAAALELFAERGFHGTAVPLVAERAKVGAGTLYRYFESKEALVNAVYQLWKDRLHKGILDGFPFDAPAREQFHQFWRRLAVFVTEHPRVFAFLELHHHAPYLDAKSRAAEAESHEFARMFFEKARQDQVVKDLDPEILKAIVSGSFLAVVKASWEDRLVLNPAALDVAEECAWEAIRR
jgi:AcrR family transcriptional regulator